MISFARIKDRDVSINTFFSELIPKGSYKYAQVFPTSLLSRRLNDQKRRSLSRLFTTWIEHFSTLAESQLIFVWRKCSILLLEIVTEHW